MFPLAPLTAESAPAVPPLPTAYPGGSDAAACLARLAFVVRLVVRYRLAPELLPTDRVSWAVNALLDLSGAAVPPAYNANPASGCHRSVAAALVNLDQFALLRLGEIWNATAADLAPPVVAEPLAVEFRWWFEIGRMLYPGAPPHATAFPTDDPATANLHERFNELSELREPDAADFGAAGEVFPPAWYWSFCRRHRLTDFQAKLVGFATYNRVGGPLPPGTSLRRPAARASWAGPLRRWVKYPLWAVASNLRWGFRCMASGLARDRFVTANTTGPTDPTRAGREQWVLNWGVFGMVLALAAALGALAWLV